MALICVIIISTKENKNSPDKSREEGGKDMFKIYFVEGNADNMVVFTNGIGAKVTNCAPSGKLDIVDLYADDAAEQLRKYFSELAEAGEINSYNELYSPNGEIEYPDIEPELENAELVYDDGEPVSADEADFVEEWISQECILVDTIRGNQVFRGNRTAWESQYSREEWRSLLAGEEVPSDFDEDGEPVEWEVIHQEEEG